MKWLQLTLLLLAFQSFFHNSLQAYSTYGDSLALVEIYNSTKGSNWSNNTNWLSAQPIETWYGVNTTNIATQKRVVALNLMNNNLNGTLPQILRDSLNILQELRIQNNNIKAFPDLSDFINLQLFNCRNNRLDFADFEYRIPGSLATFNFIPQKKYSVERFITRNLGRPYTVYGWVGGSMNIYQWYKDGLPVPGETNPTLSTPSLTPTHAGDYYCKVTSSFPMLGGLELQSETLHLTVGQCFDANGGTYDCSQMIVQYEVGTTQLQKLEDEDQYGATPIDSCLCPDIVLWSLPDSVSVEESGVAAKKRPTINDTGYNFDIALEQPDTEGNLPFPEPIPSSPPSDSNDIIIALLDTGIDYMHPELLNQIWTNNLEFSAGLDGIDNDGNCYIDDVQGYNFANHSWANYDYNGHGTHIAGILLKNTPPNVKVLNAKVFDDSGTGSLFPSICAIYYASKMKAKVISLSWGYYGNPSSILRNSLLFAQEENGALIIASAGNDTLDTNTYPHYPSGYDLDNMVTVAALNEPQEKLANYSNWGDGLIDIAAPGTNIISTKPSMAMGPKSGTSMAAGFVSKTAALLFLDRPDATFRGVKHCLLSSSDYKPILSGLVSTSGRLNPVLAGDCIMNHPKANSPNPLLDLRVMLEGPFDVSSGLMNDDLRLEGLIPTGQPFNQAPWFYEGSETLNATALSINGSNAIVDWVLIQYYDDSSKKSVSIAGLLKRNGQVVDVNNNPLAFSGTNRASRIMVSSRNHLAVATLNSISLDYLPTQIDMTQVGIPLQGGAGQLVYFGSTAALWTGDANADGVVNAADRSDAWNDRNLMDYRMTDFNLDGTVNATDRSIAWNNRNKTSACVKCYLKTASKH